jgi:iron complex transport system ATP-binding protein
MDHQIILEMENTDVGFGSGRKTTTLVRSVHAMVRTGEFICLLGPNGAGKTTLLRTIAGLSPALGGTIRMAGQLLESWSPQRLARWRAFSSTARTNPLEMSVGEFVAQGRYPHTNSLGQFRSSDRLAVQAALDSVGLLDRKDRSLETLSDGERQRAIIAMSLAQQAPLLLLDEPTAFLDALAREEIMQLLRQLVRTSARAVVATTHEIDLACSLADALWLLPVGGPFETANPSTIRKEQVLERLFRNSERNQIVNRSQMT